MRFNKLKNMKIIKVIFFNFSLFILLLIVGEVVVRVFFPNKKNYIRTFPGEFPNRYFDTTTTVVNWPKIDKDLGWVCNNKTKTLKFSNKLYNRRDIKYSIDYYGFRNIYPYSNKSKNIMILGDSFVFGVYLEDSLTIPQNLEELLSNEYTVYNFGIPGWGIDQMYLCFLKFKEKINPKITLLFFIDDDIYRVLEAYRFTEGMNKPSFEVINDTLAIRENVRKSYIDMFFEKSFLLNPFYKWNNKKKAIEITKKIFSQLNKKIGKNFYIIHIPVIEQVLFPEKYPPLISSDFYKENQINYIDVGKYIIPKKNKDKYYLKYDGHLTAKGCLLVSNIVYQKIFKLKK